MHPGSVHIQLLVYSRVW